MKRVLRGFVPSIVGASRQHRLRRGFSKRHAGFTRRVVAHLFQPSLAQLFPVRSLARILMAGNHERGLRRGRDRIGTDRIRAAAVVMQCIRTKPRIDGIDRIVNRQVHHRRGAHALEREEAILRFGNHEQPAIPFHQQRGIRQHHGLARVALQRGDQQKRQADERFHGAQPASRRAR